MHDSPPPSRMSGAPLSASDALAISALEAALMRPRESKDGRSALEVLAGSLVELGVRAIPTGSQRLTSRDRDTWLRRLASVGRSQSTISAYRIPIDDFRAWADRADRSGGPFEESAIVDYLDDYRRRCAPAPATYHRRFLLLRCFIQWFSRRNGTPDPFLDLEAPAKVRQQRDWLTCEEFAAVLACAAKPLRRRPGLAERDRLVLLGLVLTGLRRSELIAVHWRDLDLDGGMSLAARATRQGSKATPPARTHPTCPRTGKATRGLLAAAR
jgi:integrase